MSIPLVIVASTWVYAIAFAFGVVLLWRYRPGMAYGAVVLFLGISVLATAVQYGFSRVGVNNWFVQYAYPLPQILLCGIAMGASMQTVTRVGALLTVGTLAMLLRGSVTVPETVIQGMGGAWLAWTAIERPIEGPIARPCLLLRGAMLGYWGLTLPLVLLLPMAFQRSDTFLAGWLEALHAIWIVAVLALVVWLWRGRVST